MKRNRTRAIVSRSTYRPEPAGLAADLVAGTDRQLARAVAKLWRQAQRKRRAASAQGVAGKGWQPAGAAWPKAPKLSRSRPWLTVWPSGRVVKGTWRQRGTVG